MVDIIDDLDVIRMLDMLQDRYNNDPKAFHSLMLDIEAVI
jgi:hypothetical protein